MPRARLRRSACLAAAAVTPFLLLAPALPAAAATDGGAPVIASLTPNGGVLAGSTVFQVQLEDDDISYTYIELFKGANRVWQTDNTKEPGSTNSGLSPKLAVDLSRFADGAYGIKVNAVDRSGNTTTQVVPFTIDQTAPTVSFSTPAAGSVVRGTVDLGIDFADANPQAFHLAVDGKGVDYQWQPAAGHRTFALDTTTLADGVHKVVASVRDAAGNASNATLELVVDNSAPVVSFAAPLAGADLRGKVAVTVDVADANLQAFHLGVDGSGLDYAWLPTSGQRTFTLDTTTLADGVHRLHATAVDKAGNRTATTIEVSVDNTRPTLSVNGLANGDVFPAALAPEVVLDVTDAGGIDRAAVNVYRGSTLVRSLGAQSANGETTFSGTWALPTDLAPGAYTIRAGASDVAGNNRTVIVSFTVAVPAVTLPAIAPERETPAEPSEPTDPTEPTVEPADDDEIAPAADGDDAEAGPATATATAAASKTAALASTGAETATGLWAALVATVLGAGALLFGRRVMRSSR